MHKIKAALIALSGTEFQCMGMKYAMTFEDNANFKKIPYTVFIRIEAASRIVAAPGAQRMK